MPKLPPHTKDDSPTRKALKNASGSYAMAVGAVEAARRAHSWWKERHDFTISIDSEDPLFQDVSDWLLDLIPPNEQKALAAHSTLNRGIEVAESSERSAPSLQLTYDTKSTVPINVNGHKVNVSIERDDTGKMDAGRLRMKPDVITFRATSPEARDAVVGKIRDILHERRVEKRAPQLWMLSTWGSWQRRRDVPTRPLDSVVLVEGQMERLIEDMSSFLTSEAEYNKRGIPWRRGYLLHGPPGTGKTSIVKALSGHFGLDLWYAPLADVDKDTNLLTLLSEVHARSMVLLEDIDVFHAARERDDAGQGVTLSGLLNALDGVSTPHGMIFVLTTNDRSVLDDALLRTGRIDRHEEIGMPNMEQARRLFTYFYGRPPLWKWDESKLGSTADLVELFKQHMDDENAAERALAVT